MEAVLQMCETLDTNYPEHFQEFLNNCLEQFPSNFSANDYLFAAVYFIVLEYGFSPTSIYDEYPHPLSDDFDIRKMRFIKKYHNGHMKLIRGQMGEYWVYTIPLKLGQYRFECELQGVPSAENNTYLIINFLLKELAVVKSLCLDTESYTEINNSSTNHSVKLKNLKELSLLIKDQLSKSIKGTIMLHEGQGCCPLLLRLPEDIQKKVIYCLTGNSVDIQYLASTCTYFYNVIINDVKLWQILCSSEFDGRVLNEALHDLLENADIGEENLFRRVFVELKEKNMKRGYRYM
ncbi:UNVERIFIED_CONTAM: hypothetical protein PYX00_008401 [Menopon gallinae]|uniref:F-box protein n=1 Tax=Menopon gallinae TaxID=328185 RepID=A0AAW2HN13_9NEOP